MADTNTTMNSTDELNYIFDQSRGAVKRSLTLIWRLAIVVARQQRQIDTLERRLTPPPDNAFDLPVIPTLASYSGLRAGYWVRHREHPEWVGRITVITGTGYAAFDSRSSSFPAGGNIQPCVDLERIDKPNDPTN